jgi:prophage antirepressor-like protein
MMRTPQPFAIDMTNKLFFNMKDLFEHKPEFFYGCTVKKRLITKKKSIPDTEYVYANFLAKTKEWNMSDENCKKAQLLITKSWVDKYYFRSEDVISPVAHSVSSVPSVIIVPSPPPTPIILVEIKQEKEEDIKQDISLQDSERKEDKEVIENAPTILELEDEEKFHDADGNIIEIETRGEKDRNKILFNVKDVSIAFDMPNLEDTLRDIRNNYKKNIHYKKYYIRIPQVENKKITIKKRLYLTYKGLLRVLFASNNKQADKFQDWAEERLFTIQMGTKEAKEVLGTEVLNIKIENYRAVFGKYSQGFPCIYLLSLGKVGSLRETFGISAEINNDLTVYKYGFTCDIKRRLGEHNKDYGKMANVNVELELFNYVDLKYTAEAEADIRDIFEAYDNVLDVSGRNELVALNTKQFDRIKKEYVRTGREFAGATKELQEEVARLKTEIIEMRLKHQLEVQEEKMRTMEERKEKERFQVLVETNERIHTLEKSNYELRLLHKN